MDEILKLDHIYEIAEGWRESFLSFCVLFERWLRGLQEKKKKKGSVVTKSHVRDSYPVYRPYLWMKSEVIKTNVEKGNKNK